MAGSQIGRRREAALSGGRNAYVERRKKLIEAAARVFQEKGFGAASLGDVANELGTDRASLYYYVSSKEELFHAVVFHAAEENVVVAETIRDSDLSPADKLAEMIHELMLSYEKHYPYLYVYIQEKMASFQPDADHESSVWASDMFDLNTRYEAAVNAVLREGIEQGVFKSLAPERVLAYGIVGMVNWSHRWFRPEGRLSADQISRTYAEIVLKGLLTDPDRWNQPGDVRSRVWLRERPAERQDAIDDEAQGAPRRAAPRKKSGTATTPTRANADGRSVATGSGGAKTRTARKPGAKSTRKT